MRRRMTVVVVLVALAAVWFGLRGEETRQLRSAVMRMMVKAGGLELGEGETRLVSFTYGSEFEGPDPERVEVRAERAGQRLTLTVVTGPDALRGGELVFHVATVGRELSLTCTGSTIAARYLPPECR